MTVSRPVRIGLLRLTDSAPVIHAQTAGLFTAEGLDVTLSVEPSWANLADKLSYGLLDAAVMLPPLVLAMALGLRPAAARLIIPMSLSQHGDAVTLSNELAGPILAGGRPNAAEAGQRLAELLRGRPRVTLAVVHAWSTHALLFKSWLHAAGIDPQADVDWAIVPPADSVAAIESGRIDGFCAGAPWGAVAAAAGVGRTVALSSDIMPGHPEKCLAVREAWADEQPEALQGLLRALLRAAADCADPTNIFAIAATLAQPAFLNLAPKVIAASLPGGARDGAGQDTDICVFGSATRPTLDQARWFLDQMTRWRDLPVSGAEAEALAARIYRPDLYAAAARTVA
ncbi:NitT/TauT family transport system ATP-binding protein/nitrate/nitrite transport system substrate-binding protein [Nitrospirillum amazonense]|uniref:NitT/TauT family transport system ATP-binding protein/nitrate/nitrite transport system substrate-binding protein n=1 Tax=Nitrospirillum amazonense TaxID=28077 RepID=A0A560K352_9PROT|nr:ABC transporter substrate-binding protein [Nitrospirillum amazonense]TWB77707.1 NitT/TauT family transport system ATP-binding protein/nitrate/nitrite transport system substrate-binding protein [Nitrospirillum amazonense]